MSFVKQTSVYLVSNILNSAVPFILLPILTRFLSPEEYGQIAIFQSMVVGFGAFIGLNTVGAVTRAYYDEGSHTEQLANYNGACTQILLFTVFIFLLLFSIFKDTVASYLFIPNDWVYLAIAISSGTYLVNLRLTQWQVRGAVKKYGALQVSNAGINLFLTVLLVVFLNEGVDGRINAILYSWLISSFIGGYFLFKDNLINLFNLNKSYIFDALKFGVPLIPHVVGAFLITSVDRFFISESLGVKAAGIYMVAVQVSMGLTIVFDALNKAYVPWLFSQLKLNNEVYNKRIIIRTYLYFILLLTMSFIVFFIAPILIDTVVGSEYKEASEVIGWLCLGQILGGMYLMVTNYVFFAKKTIYLSSITIVCGLLNVFLIIFLIQDYALKGVAIAFVLSKFFQFILTWVIAQKVVPMPWLKVLSNYK